ncbi:MAG: hypothetical protein EOP37_01610 [Rubrivivax sp.]|nr:MAG: hypothetical protein EOP37_01610 [Rubrivivax sp.]
MEYTSKLVYRNSSHKAVLLILEPWAEQHLLGPGECVEVAGRGGAEGSAFELEQLDDCLIIYAWPGSIADIIPLEPVLR